MAAIELHDIGKEFAAGVPALSGVSLAIANGERLVLVGPSGSGKSTLLRIVAGLEAPTRGRVMIDGRDVTNVPPERRDLAMVFQSYALYPHKTVRQNLEFGLRVRRVPAADMDRRVADAAESLGLDTLLDRYPSQLSGGQRQRVALGRAIVREPLAFLFDEPLSNLDPRLRGDTRAELVALHSRLRSTMVYVTHDQEEAMTLGQRIAVLRTGAIEQVAAPDELYNRPATTFVAEFIGSPPMNLVDPAALGGFAPAGVPPGTALVGVRPHDLQLQLQSGGTGTRIELIEPLGHSQIVHVSSQGLRLVAVAGPGADLRIGDEIGLAVDPRRAHFFDRDGKRLAATPL